ncbi:hypothetical protein SASPL_116060 [Salvia splendens]|uniref:Zinc finger CHCC-type domain-containing protein n=1 Tax=Salvia splendens TaxID=180675 RepID=A0A8X8Y7R4_SALSN|nr:hypothetical protein SASPL_116060 [Salvia splendens]
MAAIGRRNGLKMATHLMKTLTGSSRSLSGIVSSEVATSHTQKWMQAVMVKITLELAIDLYTNCTNGQYACRLPSYEEMIESLLRLQMFLAVTLLELSRDDYDHTFTLELAVDLYTNCMKGQYVHLPITRKWFHSSDTSKKSPMELINEVPPIKVEDRIAVCEGDSNPALGHPVEFICLDKDEPVVCKYCGLRYVQDHHH